MVEPMGFEPTNLTVSPDDSIGVSSLNPRKMAPGSLVLDRNWPEMGGSYLMTRHAWITLLRLVKTVIDFFRK